MSKIVFIDFDGTLYTHNLHKVLDSTIESFKLLKQKKDIYTCLLTGRSIFEFDYFDFRGLKFDFYAVLNGQLILDKDFNVLYDCPIKGQLLENIINEFNKKEIGVCLCEANNFYANILTDALVDVLTSIGNPLPEVKEYSHNPIYMATVIYNNVSDLHEVIKRFGECEAPSWNERSIDIVEKGVNKGNCVKRLCQLLKVDKKDTIAFGDGSNDIEMIQEVGIGVAMGNAIDELKKVADYVTDDVDHDGIYNALKEFKII